MSELKRPIASEEAESAADTLVQICPQNPMQRKALSTAYKALLWIALFHDVEPEEKEKQLCEENENFIQTKFGYCFYALCTRTWIYNLYVHPQYRRCGHSRELLGLVVSEIRKSGYNGKIYIQAKPRENSISTEDLTNYYKSIGLEVCGRSKPEADHDG